MVWAVRINSTRILYTGGNELMAMQNPACDEPAPLPNSTSGPVCSMAPGSLYRWISLL